MKRVSRRRMWVALSLVVLAWSVIPAAQTDPAAGTWHLTVAKSKYTPGPATVTTTGTNAKGEKIHNVAVYEKK